MPNLLIYLIAAAIIGWVATETHAYPPGPAH